MAKFFTIFLLAMLAAAAAQCPAYRQCRCKPDADAVDVFDSNGCKRCTCMLKPTIAPTQPPATTKAPTTRQTTNAPTTTRSATTTKAPTTTTRRVQTTVKPTCPPLVPCTCDSGSHSRWSVVQGCLICHCAPSITTVARTTLAASTRAPVRTRAPATTNRPRTVARTTRRAPATTRAPTTTTEFRLVECQEDVTVPAQLGTASTTAKWPNPNPIQDGTSVSLDSTATSGATLFGLGRTTVSQKIKSHSASIGVTETSTNGVQTCDFRVKVIGKYHM